MLLRTGSHEDTENLSPNSKNLWTIGPQTWTFIGFVLTLLVIFLCACNFYFTRSVYLKIDQIGGVSAERYTLEQLHDMRRKINSIERFLRTTPLVECGDSNERN